MSGFAKTPEGREAAKLALLELADAFGAETSYPAQVPNPWDNWSQIENGAMVVKDPELMPIAMEGRLFLRGDKVVYTLSKPVKLMNDTTLTTVELPDPTAQDFLDYGKGLKANSEMDAAAAIRAVTKIVDRMGGDGWKGVSERIAVRDVQAIAQICGALGFFG